MENLTSEERKEVRRLYRRTLPGAICTYIRKNEEVSLNELENFLAENYEQLRTPIGAKYKGKDFKKILQGLFTDPLFVKNDNKVYLNEKLLSEFKKKKYLGILHHHRRIKGKLKFPPEVSTGTNSDKIFMIENFCGKLNKDPDFSKIFDAPFKRIKINDTYEDAGVKLGFERLIGMIQGYEFTVKYCEVYVVQEVDKQSIMEKYHASKMIRALNMVEKRLDRLEALKDAFSEKTDN